MSDFRALGQRQGILDIDAKITDCTFNLGVTEQDLNGPEVVSVFWEHYWEDIIYPKESEGFDDHLYVDQGQ